MSRLSNLRQIRLRRLAACVRVITGKDIPIVWTTGVPVRGPRAATEGVNIYVNANSVKEPPDLMWAVAHEVTHIQHVTLKDLDQEFDVRCQEIYDKLVNLYMRKGKINVSTGGM